MSTDPQHLNNSGSAPAVPDTPNTSGVAANSGRDAAASNTATGAAAAPGIPLWLKRLRRIDRSLSSALEASANTRRQAALGFPDGGGDDDDLFLFDTSTNASVEERRRVGSGSNNRSLPLVSPHINSPEQQQQQWQQGGSATTAAESTEEPAPRPPRANPNSTSNTTVSLTNAHHNEKNKVTVTFPVHGGAAGKKRDAPKLAACIPISAVSTCVVCRATPREISILEEEVARLRAFVTVQRESFQMQLDDIREAHAGDMKDARESAQAELNERLVAYMREVDDLKKHLSMAEGAVMQLATLKDQHADLSRRYETLLAASTHGGGVGAAASASPAAHTPADQKSHRSNASQPEQQAASSQKRPNKQASAASAGAVADWEIEKMELLAEVEHWKRQAVVAGVAAKTAVGAAQVLDSRSSNHSQSPPVADPAALPQPMKQQGKSSTAAAGSSSAINSQRSSGTGSNWQRPEPTYTSSLPDAMSRLEAWRKEVNPGHVTRMQQQQPRPGTRSSVSTSQPRAGGGGVEVSPSTVQQTPRSAQRRHQHTASAAEVMSSGGGSSSSPDGSLYTGASSAADGTAAGGGVQSERNRWMKLMENIVGPNQ